MMKNACCFFIFSFLLPVFLFSQTNRTIKGKVINEANGTPLQDCSVFINSTSKGAITSSNGVFELQDVPEGKYELIVSRIGFETYVLEFSSSQLPLDLRISLKQKATELSTVTVEAAPQENGWSKWGRVFVDNFIGTTPNSKSCTIKNSRVLRFWFSKKKNRLNVSAKEPLIIQNKALGYTIKFQLESFYYDFNTRISLYTGYPFFQEMNASERKQRRWMDARRKVYFGSIPHFMKSLYNNQLDEQGFQVIRQSKIFDPEKERVRDLYKKIFPSTDTFRLQNNTLVNINQKSDYPPDSIAYFNSILSKPDSYSRYIGLGANKLIKDSIGSTTKSLFFNDTLHVMYRFPMQDHVDQSTINLITPVPVQIEKNGHYYPPQELLVNGYWAVFEKIANTLPLDYSPEHR